jgi:hypothetical protein
MDEGTRAFARGDLDAAFVHFERAHILGQRFTWLHVRAHSAMFRVGWQRRDIREMSGQILRIVAASIMSRFWIPEGNTGGADVSALKPMPLPDDLRVLLERSGPHTQTRERDDMSTD